MAGEHDQPGEIARQRHAAQHRFGLGQRLFGREAGGPAAHRACLELRPDPADDRRIKAIGIGIGNRAGEAEAVADQLGGKQRPGGFDIGERRHGRELEGFPCLGGAAAQQAQAEDFGFLVRRWRRSTRFADREGRGEQHRALRAAGVATDRHIFDRIAEEAGKADGFGIAGTLFEARR